MKNTNVYYTLPKILKDQLDSIEFGNHKHKNKAKKFISKLINEGMKDNFDLREFVPLPKNYLQKIYGRYRDEFVDLLMENNIIQRNEYFNPPEIAKKNGQPVQSKSYRINPDLLLDNEHVSDSFINIREEGLEDEDYISINREVSITKDSNNKYTVKPINLSVPYMWCGIQKSILIDDFKALYYDAAKIRSKTEEVINNINPANFLTDHQIHVPYIQVRNKISNNKYWVSTEKAVEWAQSRGYTLLQDKRNFYIDDMDEYIIRKGLNIKFNYHSYSCKLNKGIFNISRNTTNTRLDSIISSMCKHTVKIIKEDNDLVEIDLCNSQFVILANWLSEEGLVGQYEDVKQFYDLCISGSLYKSLSLYMLHPSEKDTKLAMMQICFSSHKSGSEDKNKLRELFPNVVRFIDDFKRENGSEQFAIELQKREANIFIDNLLPNIKDNGFLCITKHDSLIVRRSDADEVMQIVKAYFGYKGIKCSAKCDGNIIGIGLERESDLGAQQQDEIIGEVDNTTSVSRVSDEEINDVCVDSDDTSVGMKDENGYPSIKYYRLSYNLSWEDAEEIYKEQFNM